MAGLALAFALATSGCASIGTTEPPPPSIVLPKEWQAASTDPTYDPTGYWRELGDPLIDKFVAKAILANRNLAQAAARLEQARAGVAAARAGFLPSINLNSSASRDIGDFARDEVIGSATIDASWEVDLFGRISNDVAASRADLQAAGFDLADLQRLIVGQVAQATVSARTIATQLAIARDTLQIQDENLQIAQWRLQAGLVSSLDVEQAKSQRANTAASIPALERDFAQTANAISTLLGEPPGAVREALEVSAAPIPDPPRIAGFAAPADVLRKRPDIRRAESALIAASARAGIARAQLLPFLRFSGNLGTSSGGLSSFFDTFTGSVVASLSQLIFDGGRTRAQIDSAEAAVDVSLAAWEQSILLTLEDVENAALAQTAAEERIVEFGRALEAAENAAILARSQYQAGLIDFQTLLVAENSLLNSRNALAAGEAERANAFISLTQALGGGWDREQFESDQP